MNNDQDSLFDNGNNSNSARNGVLTTVKNLFLAIPRKVRIVFSIIAFTVAAVVLLNVFKPEAQKRPVPETVVRVDVIEASRSDYPIIVTANGTIEAETRGSLVAQIRGEIVAMADNFKTGGTFEAGDVLIELDPRDYQAELSRAAASLSQADAAYRQELANAKQAEEDWKRLGNTSPAPDLVLRKPQLAAAKAQRDSAQAAADTAKLNLSRTKITAPYAGRIIQRQAVLGQYVSIGTPIAEVFSTGGVEVRLPISQNEFSQLGLDQFNPDNKVENLYQVLISTTIGGQELFWDANITRTDSTFDLNTRQIDVIAKVVDPFGKQGNHPALKIGQFVSAEIQGRTVENVFVIPNKSIREGAYTYVVRDDRLAKQNIKILWQDDRNTLVGTGFTEGELVVTTSLNSTLAGARAKLPDDFARVAKPSTQETTDSSSETVEAISEQARVNAEKTPASVDNDPQIPTDDASSDEDLSPTEEIAIPVEDEIVDPEAQVNAAAQ
jgi:RND family efflux transporter MFP subunit